MLGSFFLKNGIWGWGFELGGGGLGFEFLGKINISVPFLPTFPFVPLLPVTSLHATILPKIILSFNKQTLPTHN